MARLPIITESPKQLAKIEAISERKMKLHYVGCSGLLAVLCLLFVVNPALSIPRHIRDKRSGISDQRLAELQTLIALSKLNRNRPPVAFGVIDPLKLGKRKRSNDIAEADSFPDLYMDQLKENDMADSFRLWNTLNSLRTKYDD